MFFFVLLCSWAQAQTQFVPPVIINDSFEETNISRSVDWPVQKQKPNPAINLPLLDDALNTTGGLQVRSQGSATFSIRGSAQSGRTLVLYNGVPLNFSSGFGAPALFLPKEILGATHIIKGPASLFYGSQAMAGAINFVNRRYEKNEVVVNVSDPDESFLPWRRGGLAHQSWQWAAPLVSEDKHHVQTSFFTESDDGAFPFQSPSQSGVRESNSQNLSRGVLNGQHQWGSLALGYDALVGRQITHTPGSLTEPFYTRQENEGLLLSLSPHYFFDDQHSLKSRISHMQVNSDYNDSFGPSEATQIATILQNEYIFDWNERTQLQFFTDAFFHELDYTYAGENLKQNQLEVGPFLSFFSTDWLKHQVGLRYLTQQQLALPSAATHIFWGRHDFWLSYGEGFRNPSLTDLHSSFATFVANPDLEPEQSRQWELGWTQRPTPGTNFHWEVRLFYLEYLNFIELITLPSSQFSRSNQGEGLAQGGDLQLGWHWGSLYTEFSYNYLETRSRQTGKPFRVSPRHQISLASTYDFGPVQMEMQNTHWYRSFDVDLSQNTVALNDWQQWNFFIHGQLARDTRLSVGLINAFNEAKELTLNYPEPQRRYWLRLSQGF